MPVLLFLIGALFGLVLGTALCVRYLRQELTARIGPTMDLLALKLDNVHSAVNIALANWHAELHNQRPPASSGRPHVDHQRPPPRRVDGSTILPTRDSP